MESLTPIKPNFLEKFKDRKYFYRFFRGRSQDEIVSAIQDCRAFRNNISQSQLAELCGMKPSAVCRLEKAEYARWNFQTLWRIAEALDARWRFVLEPRETVIDQYIHRDISHDGSPSIGWARRVNHDSVAEKQDASGQNTSSASALSTARSSSYDNSKYGACV